MWFRRKWHLFFILVIILMLPPTVFCGPSDQGNQRKSDESSPTFPVIHIPGPTYKFESVVEGQSVVHDFIIQNKGTKTLDITKVRPGWGCTAVDYSRHIPPGEEGKITIKVNTRGFGGREIKKSILVYTNDKNRLKLSLKVTGDVKKFVTITPSKVRLTGPGGLPVMTSVNIVPEKEYMFKVLSVEAKNGKFVDAELKDTSKGKEFSYMLIVKNKKDGPGRFFDVLKLKTDSEIQPEIDIRVYGNIVDKPDEKGLKKGKSSGPVPKNKNS